MNTMFERALGLEPAGSTHSENTPTPTGEVTYSGVGNPVTFSGGQIAGMTLRATVEEIQHATSGRKASLHDRRPLDPPPVVQLRLFRVLDAGTTEQSEEELKGDMRPEGWLCHADLFTSSPKSIQAAESKAAKGNSDEAEVAPPAFIRPLAARIAASAATDATPSTPHPAPPPDKSSPPRGSPDPARPQMDTSPTDEPAPPLDSSEPPATADGPSAPVSEPGSPQSTPSPNDRHVRPPGVRVTQSLAGATFVQAHRLHYVGQPTLIFPFSDLSVKAEGEFVLRYRVFNVLAAAAGIEPRPVLAECLSAPFRVYGTKDFPGLAASTELTKQIARAGIRVNTREMGPKGHKRSAKSKAEEST